MALIALVRLVGAGLLLMAFVAFLDQSRTRWLAAGLLAAAVSALLFARLLTTYFRYREAFVQARRGARKVARERRKQGHAGYVPRSREALLVRRLVPGAGARQDAATERLRAAVRPHLPELAARRDRLMKREYGRDDATAWQRKLVEFMETVVLNEVGEADLNLAVPFVYRWYPEVRQDDARATRYGRWDRRMYCAADGDLACLIDTMITDYMASGAYRMAAADADTLDGPGYELHCAHVLRECGWRAEVMGGAGDQGADVIAERGKLRVVIQCKRYSRAVNNKAVQEAIAGKMMHRAQAAAVVSTAPYTKGAEELARTAKVLLLHHTELLSLDARLAEIGVLKPERADAAADRA